MRRSARGIKDRKEIESIIQSAQVCRIGLSEDNVPYVVPMNFGYKDNCLYFHCAKAGKKIDVIRQNNKVCFEMDIDQTIVNQKVTPADTALNTVVLSDLEKLSWLMILKKKQWH